MRGLIFFAAIIQFSSARTVNVDDISQLATACRNAVPGDEIVIAKGVHTLREKSRIAITNRPGPIMVRGVTGNAGDVIIEGLGQDDTAVEMIFELTDSPQWTFRDFTTRNTYYHGFKFNGASSHCVLRHLVMRDHGESGVKGTCEFNAKNHPDGLLVDACDIGFTQKSGGTRSVVEGIDGVAVKDWIIRNNRFLNVQKAGQPAYAVFTKGNSQDTLIEGNRFEDCFIGASFGGGGTDSRFFRDDDHSFEHRRGFIRKNTFIRCTDAAIYINKGNDCTIAGNIMTGCNANIQLRHAESTARVTENQASDSTAPLLKLRDGAKELP